VSWLPAGIKKPGFLIHTRIAIFFQIPESRKYTCPKRKKDKNMSKSFAPPPSFFSVSHPILTPF
jgi:hypothetical protein